jgi:hypothetical protein
MSEQERIAKPANAAPKSAVAPFPDSLELAEQIVDSQHVFPLVTPKLNTYEPVRAVVSIEPAVAQVSRKPVDELVDRGMEKRRAEAFSPVAHEHYLDERTSIPVRFWPKFTGDHEADVRVLLRYDDGTVELRTIRVNGHARRLGDAPAHAIDGPRDGGEYRDPEIPTANLEKVPDLHRDALDNATKESVRAAGNLARQQRAGLDTARDNALAYSRKPPETTGWDWLAELAITMAVGGVASIVAKAVALKLGPRLERLPIVQRIKDEKKREKFTQDPVGDVVKDGLKSALKGPAVQLALGDKKEKKHENEGGTRSSNGEIEFFARQREALNHLADENEKFVLRQHRLMQHGLLTAPERAIATMQSIHEGFDEKARVVPSLQQTETELQWVSLIAKSENSSEKVAVNGETRDVTNLRTATAATRGVLKIRVIDGEVKGASIDGVSQEIADNLRTLNLHARPVPIVILYGEPASFITRDEVGRVRLPFLQKEAETERHREAQALVDRVLSKSLAQWGVREIKTDDGTGRT